MNFIIKINMFYREKNKRRLTYQKVSYKIKVFPPAFCAEKYKYKLFKI